MKKDIKTVLLLLIISVTLITASCSTAETAGDQTTSASLTETVCPSSVTSAQTDVPETESTVISGTESEYGQTDVTVSSTASESGSTASTAALTESTEKKTESSAAKTTAPKASATSPKPTVTKKTTVITTEPQTTVPVPVTVPATTTETSGAVSTTATEAQTTSSVPVVTSPPPVDPSKMTYKLSFDNITDISKSNNVFVFIIDRFDRVFAETAFKNAPSVFSSLEGFTYFSDNISLYGHTYPSIAYMVTGNKFNGENRKDYLAKAYGNASTLEELEKNGYRVGVYTDSYYGYNTDNYVSKYVSNAVDNNSEKAKYSTKLDTLEEFYKDAKFELTNEKVFSFIHLAGCHDCYFGGGTAPENLKEAQVEKAVNALNRNFSIINKYIQKMKEWGVYENATIIITGDHGAAISDKKPLDGIRTTALFVKPSGSGKGSIVRSSAQVCQDNLWATIFGSEKIKTSKSFGKSVFDIAEGTDAVRTYLWHALVKNEADKTVYIEYKYTVTGSALDFGNWSLTETKEYNKSLYT